MKSKELLVVLLSVVLMMGLASCSKDDDNGNENVEFKALFYTTDKFVKDLGYSSSFVDSETTSDKKYIVTVIGRTIVVKKNSYTGPSYSEVRDALYSHYKSNSRVNDVFVNQNGTVTIDCRK